MSYKLPEIARIVKSQLGKVTVSGTDNVCQFATALQNLDVLIDVLDKIEAQSEEHRTDTEEKAVVE